MPTKAINTVTVKTASQLSPSAFLIGHDSGNPAAFRTQLAELLGFLVETGTFTPTLGADTTDPTVTYASRSGYYAKVGKLVFVTARVVTSARSGGSGGIRIKGLPFPCASAVSPGAQLALRAAAITWTAGQLPSVDVIAGTSEARLQVTTPGGSATNLAIGNWTATGDLWVSGTYATP